MSTTRRRPVRRAVVLAPALLAGLALTGCGSTDEQPRPGLAASVEGTDISLGRVDEATTQYCSYYGEDQTGQAQPFPRSFQRQQVAGTFILEAAFAQILEERDLSPGEEYDGDRADIEAQFGDRPDSDGLVDFLEADAYVTAAVAAVSAAEGAGAPASPDQAPPGLVAGFEWLRENDVDINPVVGLDVTDAGLVTTEGSDLSVAVSTEARASSFGADDPDVPTRVAELVETLPADQVCGA